MSSNKRNDPDLTVNVGEHQLIVHHRYEVLTIFNEVLLAITFTVGSICFLISKWEDIAAWLFLIGSIHMGIRPFLRMCRHIHLRKGRRNLAKHMSSR
ncbi:YrhK family protein [Tuberibacillus sp. Marseille-P3662]|uniref:YrhK family protein n=1 Tax=Tuberibacillus sp. Marseille-P3662 TaxID=1965358 RepID=UPI00111C9339|nr:YrhK family protein [Tuberibacillus sp. Marseille-P3662]